MGRARRQGIDHASINAILAQVKTLLKRYIETGKPGVIDMKQMPRMNAATYGYLKEIMARGEVSAVVENESRILISETEYPGIWWVIHHNDKGEPVTELLEICAFPEILASHVADMREGCRRLERLLTEKRSPIIAN